MREIYKDISNYENLYQVSNFGRVRSIDRIINQIDGRVGTMVQVKYKGKLLKQATDYQGRKYVGLSKNSKIKSRRVHQLVAETFLNHIPNGVKNVIDHIDNNPSNNRLDNLQVITQRENTSKDKNRSLPTGVSRRNRKKPYFTQIRIGGKSTYLGSYETVQEAEEVYNNALKLLKP